MSESAMRLPPRLNDEERNVMWKHIKTAKWPRCWRWTGPSRKERPVMQVRGRCVLVTHVAMLFFNRKRSSRLLVLHSCDNAWCVNPRHLRFGTAKENANDLWIKTTYCGVKRKPTRHRGVSHYASTLLEPAVHAMRSAYDSGADITTIAIAYKVPYGTARGVVTRRTYRNIEEREA